MTELDLGGLVKEYAADLGASLCRHAGLSGLVDLGGAIAIAGTRPDGLPWRIGLRDPHRPGAILVVAGSATTIAMLKEREGPAWLEELGLPHLWVDADGRVGGMLAGGA